MAGRYFKYMSGILSGEMKIKTNLRFHLNPVKMIKIKNKIFWFRNGYGDRMNLFTAGEYCC